MCSLKQNDIINENRYEEAQDMIQEQQKYADDYCGVPAPQSDKEVMKRILIQVPYLPEPKMDKIIKIFDELNKIVPLDIEYYPDSKIPDFDFTPQSDKEVMKETIGELIRDITKAGFMPKSTARIRINKLIKQEIIKEKLAWMNGERCGHCGNQKKQNLSDVCSDCIEII